LDARRLVTGKLSDIEEEKQSLRNEGNSKARKSLLRVLTKANFILKRKQKLMMAILSSNYQREIPSVDSSSNRSTQRSRCFEARRSQRRP
jgi:hypothetical protein